MQTATKIKTLNAMIDAIGFQGQSLLSINDLTNEQIYGLFELALALEPWNRSRIDLLPGSLMATLFFQPSTRTRMSFETAMARLGGAVVTEANPMVSSSAAKEESLADMMKVVSKYANVIVLRHPNDVEARDACTYSESPIISGGFGHWEHPTQALLDMYTLWRTQGKIEGCKSCDCQRRFDRRPHRPFDGLWPGTLGRRCNAGQPEGQPHASRGHGEDRHRPRQRQRGI